MEKDYTLLVKEIFSKREKPPLCYVHSFGCQQNVNDGERITGMLCEMGCIASEDIDSADIIILNTCAVRENAEQRVFGNIGELLHLKEKNPSLLIGICGCMAQQEKTLEKIKASYRHVDIVFGTFAHNELPRLIYEALKGKRPAVDIGERENVCPEDMPAVRKERFRAGVSVMYGCNNFCTYCIVPYVRGRERSRKPENILKEIRGLAENGCREIMLLGQNVNSYGRGLDEKIDFPELLRRIDSLQGDFRVRFMSPHPKDATKELFDVMAGSGKICRSIHLPLQSGSDRILSAMNRRYTVSEYLEKADYARSVMPGLSVTTDIIVGFPGETREDFEGTLEVMKRIKYDNIYSFIYSPREGTKAALMENSTPPEEISARFRELLELQRKISEENYRRFEGAEFEVLFDGVHKSGQITGKSDEGIITLVKGDNTLIGQLRRVKVTKAHNWAVEGELME